MDEFALHSILFQKRAMHQYTHTSWQINADYVYTAPSINNFFIELMLSPSKTCQPIYFRHKKINDNAKLEMEDADLCTLDGENKVW